MIPDTFLMHPSQNLLDILMKLGLTSFVVLVFSTMADVMNRAFKQKYEREAWVFSVLLLGPIGVLAYYLFGRDRSRGKIKM